jgi:hypothetical protein
MYRRNINIKIKCGKQTGKALSNHESFSPSQSHETVPLSFRVDCTYLGSVAVLVRVAEDLVLAPTDDRHVSYTKFSTAVLSIAEKSVIVFWWNSMEYVHCF